MTDNGQRFRNRADEPRGNFRISRPDSESGGRPNWNRSGHPSNRSGRAKPQPVKQDNSSRQRKSTPNRGTSYIRRTFDSNPATHRNKSEELRSASDTLAELFTFDIPMRGERFEFKKFANSHRREIFIGLGSAAGVVLLIGSFMFLFKFQSGSIAKNNSGSGAQQKVGFNPLVPLGKESKTGNELKDSDYYIDSKKNVLGYNSEYNGVNITVSQQKLPDDIKANPEDGLAGVANSLGANEKFETQKGMAYLKTGKNTGKQIAVFATDENLVFIQTEKEMLSDDWEFYINQLSPY